MTTKREFLDRVIKELNLDISDPFTLILANAFALDDLRRVSLPEATRPLTQPSPAGHWPTPLTDEWAKAYNSGGPNAPTILEFMGRLERDRARLVEALRDAIKLACEWHEPEAAGDKKAYRFDLSDHPRIKPLRALLRELEEAE